MSWSRCPFVRSVAEARGNDAGKADMTGAPEVTEAPKSPQAQDSQFRHRLNGVSKSKTPAPMLNGIRRQVGPFAKPATGKHRV